MKRHYLRLVVLMLSALLLLACAEKTPQEVTTAFWQAVISNDADDVVKYSTLGDAREFDGFGRNWSGFTPSFGRIVIEGDEAMVATRLAKTSGTGEESVTFETVLIRQEGNWKVDYARTGKEATSGPLGKLFGQLERMGKSLSAQFGATSDELAREMERMGTQLGALSETLGAQATELIEQHGEALRKSIDELAESARRALEEQEQRLSDGDRQVLQEVANDLEKSSEQLAEPTVHSVAASGKEFAVARQRLAGIDNDAIAPYQEQWQQWGEQFETEMQKLVDEVSALTR
ncbi:MAG TPA: hypothetical protein VGE00_01210 [Gammaproteobacteria bacterium]